MNYKEFKRIYESFKKWPIITITFLVVCLIIFIFSKYFGSYFSEKGKQFANPQVKLINDRMSSEEIRKYKNNSKSTSKINQHTEGNQSPAVISNKDVNINIEVNDNKEKNK